MLPRLEPLSVSLIGGSVLLADQALKAVVLRVLGDREVRVGSTLRIRLVRGSPTFGSRVGLPAGLMVALWLALVAALVGTSAVAPPTMALVWIAAAGAVGGAGSNVIDQLVRGVVVDYVDLRVWPVFNLADVAIVAGVVTALAAAITGAA